MQILIDINYNSFAGPSIASGCTFPLSWGKQKWLLKETRDPSGDVLFKLILEFSFSGPFVLTDEKFDTLSVFKFKCFTKEGQVRFQKYFRCNSEL